MAHKKGAGSSDNGRDSKPKFLGVKLYGGQAANAGSIILRQRGTRYHIGLNTYLGKDHTIHAKVDGHVYFTKHRGDKTSVSIRPLGYEEVAETVDTYKKAAAPKAATAPKAVAVKKAEPKPATVAEPVVEKVVELVAEPLVAILAEPVVEAVAETSAAAEAVAAMPAVVAPEPVAEVKSAAKLPKGVKQDDLKIVEGIGPKIESLLHDAGIKTWVELSETPVEKLKGILEAAGSRYQMHDPGTWPKQSQYAAEGKFEELKEWQELLDGGKSGD